jgi:hypothetical protein
MTNISCSILPNEYDRTAAELFRQRFSAFCAA